MILHPLPAHQLDGTSWLRAVQTPTSTSAAAEDDARFGTGQEDDAARRWRALQQSRRAAGAEMSLLLEVAVTDTHGPAPRVITLRSLVSVQNSTRVPCIVRLQSGAARSLLRACLSAVPEAGDLLPDDAAFPGALDRATAAIAQGLRNAAAQVAARSLAARRSVTALKANEPRRGTIGHDHPSGASARGLFASRRRARDSIDNSISGSDDDNQSRITAHTDDVDAYGGANSSGALVDVDISCWEAAATGLPLERVLLPGYRWSVPLPFSQNSRLWLRPAMQVEQVPVGVRAVPVAGATDNGGVMMRTLLLPQRKDDSNIEGLYARTMPTPAPNHVDSSIFSGQSDIDAGCGSFFIADSRFGWAAFEEMGVRALTDVESYANLLPPTVAPHRSLLDKLFRKSVDDSFEVDEAAGISDGGSTFGISCGLALDSLAADAVMRAAASAAAMLDNDNSDLDASRNDDDDDDDGFDGDVYDGELGGSSVTSASCLLAVCGRGDRGAVAVPPPAGVSAPTLHRRSAAQGSTVTAPSAIDLVQSTAFFYCTADVSIVSALAVDAVPSATVTSGAQPIGLMQSRNANSRAETALRESGASISIDLFSPVQIVNHLPCDMQYEVGVPRRLGDEAHTAPLRTVRATNPAHSTTASTNSSSVSSNSSPFRWKVVAGSGPVRPSESLGSAVAAKVESSGVSPADEIVIVASGTLHPAETLSLLYAHPSVPRCASSGGANRSRARYRSYFHAARYVRALSLRVSIPSSPLTWGAWTGIFTEHASAQREAAIASVTAPGVALPILPPLRVPRATQTLAMTLTDAGGGGVTLNARSVFAAGAAATRARVRFSSRPLTMTIFAPAAAVNATGLPLLLGVPGRGRSTVLAGGQSLRIVEEAWENERLQFTRWGAMLLPTDPPHFSDVSGISSRPLVSFNLPPSWSWDGEWKIDIAHAGVDAEGWQYSFDFLGAASSGAGWAGSRGAGHFVRRRRWTRVRVPSQQRARDDCTGDVAVLSSSTARGWLVSSIDFAAVVSGAGGRRDSVSRSVISSLQDDRRGSLADGRTVIDGDGASASTYKNDTLVTSARALEALGVVMFAPPVADTTDCCSLIVADTEWSAPVALGAVGRPCILALRERESITPGVPRALYDVVVTVRPQIGVADSTIGSGSAATSNGSKRSAMTRILDVNPRFVIANVIDGHLAAVARGAADPAGGASMLRRIGVYLLQVAPAAAPSEDGTSSPAAVSLAYLAGISSGTQLGGDQEYDLGAGLYRALVAGRSALRHVDSTIVGSDDEALDGGKGTYAPAVLTVPPGECAPFYFNNGCDGGSAEGTTDHRRVCIRVARFMLAPPIPGAADGGGGGVLAGRSTVVIPVTAWSGAISLSRVADDVPVRLEPAVGLAARLVGAASDVILRVAVREHPQHRGTIMLTVSADAGLMSIPAALAAALDGSGASLLRASSTTRPRTGMTSRVGPTAMSLGRSARHSSSPLRGGSDADTATASSLAARDLQRRHAAARAARVPSLVAVFWGTGIGQLTPASVRAAMRADIADAGGWEAAERRGGLASAVGSVIAPPLFRIDNQSLDSFVLRQIGLRRRGAGIVVPPRSSVLFAFDEPEIPASLISADLVVHDSLVSGSATRRKADGNAVTAGGDSAPGPTMVSLEVTTQPLVAASSSSVKATSEPSRSLLRFDLLNVAGTSSLALPPGRAVTLTGADDSSSTISDRGNLANSTYGTAQDSAKVLIYEKPVLICARKDGAKLGVGKPYELPEPWRIARLASGDVVAIESGVTLTAGATEIRSTGGFVTSARCTIEPGVDETARLAAGHVISDADSAADCTFTFIPVSASFGWPGLAPGARRALRRQHAASSSAVDVDELLSQLRVPSDERDATTIPAAESIAVRYGDLVMVQFDAESSAVRADSDPAHMSASSSEVARGIGVNSAIHAERTQPLLLVAHRDGTLEFLDRAAALAVASPASIIPADQMDHGNTNASVLACAVYMVVGGAPGAPVQLAAQHDSARAEGAASRRKNGSTLPPWSAVATGDGSSDSDVGARDVEESDDDGEKNKASSQGREATSTGTGFGLLPVAWGDRLIEAAHGEDDKPSAAVAALKSLRQCIIPPLSSLSSAGGMWGGRTTTGIAADEPTTGVRVISAMQRKRMMRRGIGVHAGAATTAAALPIPSTPLPPELRAGEVARLATLLPDAFDAPDGDGSPSPAAAVAADAASATAPKFAVRGLQHLPLCERLPDSCLFSALPLASVHLPARVLAVRVGIDGPTRVVTLTTHAVAATSSTLDTAPTTPVAAPQKNLRFRLEALLPAGASVSVIDSGPEEVAVLDLTGITAMVSSVMPYITAEITIEGFQIDSELPGAAFPVVVARAVNSQSSAASQRPLVQASFVYETHASTTARAGLRGTGAHSRVIHVPFASLLIQELDVCLDESFLRALIALPPRELFIGDETTDPLGGRGTHGEQQRAGNSGTARDVSSSPSSVLLRRRHAGANSAQRRARRRRDGRGGIGAARALSLSTASEAASLVSNATWWWPVQQLVAHNGLGGSERSKRQIYLENLSLGSFRVNVSFQPGETTSVLLSNDRADVTPLQRRLAGALSAMSGALSLQRAPLRLAGLEMINVLAAPAVLQERIAQHYIATAASEAYKLVFSADLLGRPLTVAETFGRGARDFFVEPALARSPLELLRGGGRGTLSLLSNTVAGVAVSVAAVTSSLGRGVESLALDAEYARERADARGAAAAAIGSGGGESLLDGARELGLGIAQGLAGVILDPLRGAQDGGAAGFATGIGKGLIGLVVKPTAAALNATARAAGGVVATAQVIAAAGGVGGGDVDVKLLSATRRRESRLFWGVHRALVPHDARRHAVILAVVRAALEEATATARTERVVAAAARGNAASTFSDDVRELMSGSRDAAARAARRATPASHLYHLSFRETPYLLIFTTSTCILARSARRAAAGTDVINLCWQVPVVRESVLSKRGTVRFGDYENSYGDQSDDHVDRSAGAAAYRHVLESIADVTAAALAAAEGSHSSGFHGVIDVLTPPTTNAYAPISPRTIVSTQALMALDSLVTTAFASLRSDPAQAPEFQLPVFIIAAMDRDALPAPLHFGDAASTLANVRPDERPDRNIAAFVAALDFAEAAVARALNGRPPLTDAELALVFRYILAHSAVERPVLCTVLADAWRRSRTPNARETAALSMLTSAIAWSAAVAARKNALRTAVSSGKS